MSVNVHNHGTEDGPGLACNELLLTNGQKIGACQIRTHLTNAWDEGLLSAGLDPDYTMQIMSTNPYTEES